MPSNNFPQLRVRTGFSFRHAYGRIPEVVEHLKAIGSTSAAIVDFNTWGHAKFEKAAGKAGIVPLYGCEIPIVTMDEAGDPKTAKPLAWVLAKDTKALYNLTTLSAKTKGLTRDVFGVQPGFMQDGGLIKFPGGAIDSLHYGDYDFIDINPSSFLLAARGIYHHRVTGIPIVITSYNDMPSTAHRSNAYSWEVRESVGMRHIATVEEIWSQLKHIMTREEFDSGIENAFKIQDLLKDTKLQRAPIINVEGDLAALCEVGRKSRLKRGHIDKWTKEYKDRLAEELKQIKAKGFDSYFIVVADLIQFAKQHMLVGPARGSSAGSLVCYLIGITEVDPIPHKLLFQRFIDVSRSDWPDIDIDFSDTKRFMVFDYLKEKYGVDRVSKLGSVSTLQPRSIMPQVGKKFRIPIDDNFQVVNALIEYPQGDPRYGHALEDTFEKTPQGQTFKKRYPAAAACMVGIELHESHSGVHAAGIIVCNDPVSDYCTVSEEGIPQIDKVDAEQLNLLKIDALGLRTLGIIEDANVVTAEELYSLKLDDPEVLKILTDDKVSGVFQFEGSALRGVTKQMNAVDEFNKIVNLTALARPGPLGSNMATTYINRSNGKSAVKYDVPQLEPFLKDTFGVIVYQEQLMAILREVGRFDWAKTSEVRKGMSKSKGEEYLNQWRGDFVKGAIESGVPEPKAENLWKEMATFGAYGFNLSHSVSYAIVTYWTCYLKRYHKLEFAAACLRSAKDHEQTIAILRELAKEGVSYTAIDPAFSDMNWKVADGRLIGGIMNAKGYGPVKAMKYIQSREKLSIGPLPKKEHKAIMKAMESLANAEVQYADLSEAHTKWGHLYKNPRLVGVTNGDKIIGMNDAKDGQKGDVLIIAKLIKKEILDENDSARIKKRHGRRYEGPSQILDMWMVDDSTDNAVRFRVRPERFEELAKEVVERAPVNSWFLMRAWKIPEISMFIVKKLKWLDKPPEERKDGPLMEMQG